MSAWSATQLSIAPLGAGDLIDRAVRLYRRHLFVLIRTAAPPVIIVAAGWILLSISIRRVFLTSETSDVALYFFLSFLSAVLMLGGYLFMLVVMGGATRTLVAHLLRNEPVTARATYNAVRARFWGLSVASVIVFAWILASSTAAFIGWEIAAFIFILGATAISSVGPAWLAGIVIGIGFLLATILGIWVFFLVVGRVAYVPQVISGTVRCVFEVFFLFLLHVTKRVENDEQSDDYYERQNDGESLAHFLT